jgi:Na+/proline symporter
MVIVITCSGGLWAVLMTDVLQFVILTVSVVFVVPLILMEAGGWTAFIDATPEGFTSPIASDYTWWFIIGWMVVNFFNIGGEWTFVQRYMCVPTAKDAKKAAFLFGTLYLVSPLIWMLPPLVYRVLNDSAEPAEAYVLACRHVLPAGMMGLMVAAMASATASMATTRLNTFSGAITSEVYHRVINRTASDSQLVFVGRIATVVLGMVVTAGALLIPRYGYTSFIIDINTLLAGPMLLPGLWGLFSRKIGPFAVWSTIAAGAVVAYLVKFALAREGFLTTVDSLQPLVQWIAANSRIVDLTAGIVFPLVLMTTMELMTKHEHPGYAKVQEFSRKFHEEPDLQSSPLPAKMVAISLVIIAAVMLVLAVLDPADANVLGSLAVVLTTISGVIHWSIRRGEKAAA